MGVRKRMLRLLTLAACALFLSGFGPVTMIGGGVPIPVGAILYQQDFEGASTEWVDEIGTPDHSFTDGSDWLRVDGVGPADERADCDSCWTGEAAICLEFDIKLVSHNNAQQFLQMQGTGISSFSWRLNTSSTDSGNISGQCGASFIAVQDLVVDTTIGVEWELTALTGTCRVSFDDATPIVVDGADEDPGDLFTGLRFQTNGAIANNVTQIDNIVVRSGTCPGM